MIKQSYKICIHTEIPLPQRVYHHFEKMSIFAKRRCACMYVHTYILIAQIFINMYESTLRSNIQGIFIFSNQF